MTCNLDKFITYPINKYVKTDAGTYAAYLSLPPASCPDGVLFNHATTLEESYEVATSVVKWSERVGHPVILIPAPGGERAVFPKPEGHHTGFWIGIVIIIAGLGIIARAIVTWPRKRSAPVSFGYVPTRRDGDDIIAARLTSHEVVHGPSTTIVNNNMSASHGDLALGLVLGSSMSHHSDPAPSAPEPSHSYSTDSPSTYSSDPSPPSDPSPSFSSDSSPSFGSDSGSSFGSDT